MWTPGTSTLPNLPQVYLLRPGETLQNWFCRFSPRNKFTKVSSIPYMLGLCKTLRIQRWIEHNFCSKALFCFLNQVGKQTLLVARLTGLYWPWELGARNPWRAVFTKPTLRSLHTRARGQVRGLRGGGGQAMEDVSSFQQRTPVLVHSGTPLPATTRLPAEESCLSS